VPIPVKGITTAIAVDAGGPSDYVLLRNGTLLAWGANFRGQLGDGTTVEKPLPTAVKHLGGVVALAAGGLAPVTGHALALLSSGTVMAWGDNAYGQLGVPTAPATVTEAVPVTGLSNVAQLAAGAYQSVARMGDGTVMAWGSNYGGARGRESCGRSIVVPCSRVPLATGVKHANDVSAGFGFSDAVSEGRAYAWGHDPYGQLGIGTITDSIGPVEVHGLTGVLDISAGQHHNLAVVEGAATPPTVELVSGKESVTLLWRAAETGNQWGIGWRPVTRPLSTWKRISNLPAGSRSYTISGLQPGMRYEAYVWSKVFTPKVAWGVAGY
jgi:alpha-tubulin suppressor-like RCC1 family protein